MEKSKKSKTLIIGGGYTGLVAAIRLAEMGHNVTIAEKSSIVGGLASDFKVEGASLERAYHHIFKTDTDIITMAKELGVSDKIKWHDSSVSIYFNNKLYPFKGALDLVKFMPLSFINRLRAGIVVLYLQKTKNWETLQGISAYSWMLKYAGKQVVDVIWEPLLLGKFNRYYKDVSMAWLWARIHIRAQSREAGGEKLGYFDGGFQVFTDALTSKLNTLGVKIITNSQISGIESQKSNKVKIHYNDKNFDIFDICIVTTPSYVFANLIKVNKHVNQLYISKLNSIDYLGARLLIFSSTQKISDYYWHNINDTKLPFLVFINHTKLISKKKYKNKYIYYIATYVPHDDKLFKMDNNKIQDLWFKSLKSVFPNFDVALINETHHFKFANAQHIVNTSYSKKIPGHITPLKNIYLSNFSQIYPEDRGTNYAVKEGNNIAEIVLNEQAKY